MKTRLPVWLLLLALLLSALPNAAAAPAAAPADTGWYIPGSSEFRLETADQLAGLAQLVNDGTEDFAGKTVVLGADVTLTGPWTPIGTAAWAPAEAAAGRLAAGSYEVRIAASNAAGRFCSTAAVVTVETETRPRPARARLPTCRRTTGSGTP